MNAFKALIMIVLVMAIFTLFVIPMEDGTFPSWIETELAQIMLLILIVTCAVALIP